MTPHNHPITKITLDPEFVRREITTDINLTEKVGLVVITDYEDSSQTASLYRESSSEPGRWSEDIYVWREHWVLEKKNTKKYPTLPTPPASAMKTEINGVDCWSMRPLTEEQRRTLCEKISPTPLPMRMHAITATSPVR